MDIGGIAKPPSLAKPPKAVKGVLSQDQIKEIQVNDGKLDVRIESALKKTNDVYYRILGKDN